MSRLGLRVCQGRRPLGAGVAELVDAATSHVAERKLVWVRLPPPARPWLLGETEIISFRYVRGCRVARFATSGKPGSQSSPALPLEPDIPSRIAPFHLIQLLLRLLQPPRLLLPVDHRARPVGQILRAEAHAQHRAFADAGRQLEARHLDRLSSVTHEDGDVSLEPVDGVEGSLHGFALQAGDLASTGAMAGWTESWVKGRNCTTPFGSAQSVVMTKLPSSFATTKTVPSRSVRYTRAPAFSH